MGRPSCLVSAREDPSLAEDGRELKVSTVGSEQKEKKRRKKKRKGKDRVESAL